MVHKRSSGDIVIETKINGTDRRLYLKPNKGLFAGKSTKIFTAKIDPEDGTKFVYTAHSGVSSSCKNRMLFSFLVRL